MAKLYYRYGAMGSSKTANALMVQYNYMERGQNAILLKPKLDSRDGDRIIASRIGLKAECGYVEEFLESFDTTSFKPQDREKNRISAKKCDAIIVDEAQFLSTEQVDQLSDIVDFLDIPVLCYGLRTDFQGHLFEGAKRLMETADVIEEIQTVCWCGRRASFNARVVDGKLIKSGEQIMLGGNEAYISLCRKHFKLGMLHQQKEGRE